MAKKFLTILDAGYENAHRLIERARRMKEERHRSGILSGKNVVLLFQKASTRTRVSFEVGINHLGGNTLFLTDRDSQVGRDEPLRDAARVLSRYADCLVVRTFAHSNLEELADHASIPVINALSDDFHPCQVMSDLLTIYEHSGRIGGLKIAWVGDGNNMANSWINAAIYFHFELYMAFPEGFEPRREVLDRAFQAGAKIFLTHDPYLAVDGVNYINTDTWASMGQEGEKKKRETIFSPYQVNSELLAHAAPDCKVLHCLPAYRGQEITDEVIEGPASLVWDQAENRLHMQKAILEWIMQ